MDAALVSNLLWPLARLLLGLALALLAANVLEALQWTRYPARLAAPLARLAHLGETAGASFALAFLSPTAANGLLAKAHDEGRLSRKEVMLANLFNSFPNFLVHLPALFLLAWPVLGPPAACYAALCLLAAAARTLLTMLAARVLLPRPGHAGNAPLRDRPRAKGGEALRTAWDRFRSRLPRLVCVTIPVYILMYLLQKHGWFGAAQDWLAGHADWLSFLKPQALGIIVLYLAAEMGAALSAAGSVFNAGGLSSSEVVLALLVGNILSTPMRAIRHQLPSYAGLFKPALALELVLANQVLRAASMAGAAWLYWRWG
ncbi:MAG: hypothetical protein LBC79_09610 [Deltaproteobacteria bacterium]|jgi:hypothetical protein|nr:hypothetical protein [Deltaproteobacteria bacterium]